MKKTFNISIKPKISLGNYLLDLVTESDGKNSSLYLKNVESFIQEIWEELTKSNWRKLRLRRLVPRRLGIDLAMIYSYKNGKKGISIQTLYQLLLLWQEYCQKTPNALNQKWDEIYKSNFCFSVHRASRLCKLPKYLNPELSYLIGWLSGDGHFGNYGNHYLVKVSEKSTNQLNYVIKPLFENLFNAYSPIHRMYKGGYAVQLNSKPIFRFLTQVLKIKVGEIPNFIFKLDKINKRHFLMGVFDSEGCVHKNRYKISIAQSKTEFLNQLNQLFDEIGIKFNGPIQHKTKLGTWYTIRLEKKSKIIQFKDLIGSYHIDKAPELEKMINRIQTKSYDK